MTEQEYQQRIAELEREVSKLQTEVRKNSETKYGLRWMDVPEAFDSEDRIPILEEVKERAIPNHDGQPTHILIEGDNYHALTCLNYTHKGKIDVIYIDPPYNTGSDGFVYKDKRVLETFPDGQPVPVDHPLRHSYWLSFMSKRLELAKNLLSDKGVIFISIDDNEVAQLKLLCDKIFGESSFIGSMPRVTKKGGKDHSIDIAQNHDYLLVYRNSFKAVEFNGISSDEAGFENIDEYVSTRGKYKLNQTLDYDSLWYNPAMDFPLEIEDNIYYPGGSEVLHKERHQGNHTPKDWVWRWSKAKFDFGYKNGFIEIKKGKDRNRIYTKTYLNASIEKEGSDYTIAYKERETKLSSLALTDNAFSNDNAKKEIASIIGGNAFDFPKPSSLINQLLHLVPGNGIVLDFFAGSGTTMHATMQMNKEDGGHRQCILVTNNENNICEEITYERNKRVMCGYTNAKGQQVEGLGGSMKYYKAAFVGEHNHEDAMDSDRIALAHNAGSLLALAENTLEEVKATEYYQIFKEKDGDIAANGNVVTAIYFTDDLEQFGEFVAEIENIQQEQGYPHIAVYLFCWDSPEDYKEEFDDMRGLTLKAIPQPILDIYKRINS